MTMHVQPENIICKYSYSEKVLLRIEIVLYRLLSVGKSAVWVGMVAVLFPLTNCKCLYLSLFFQKRQAPSAASGKKGLWELESL